MKNMSSNMVYLISTKDSTTSCRCRSGREEALATHTHDTHANHGDGNMQIAQPRTQYTE